MSLFSFLRSKAEIEAERAERLEAINKDIAEEMRLKLQIENSDAFRVSEAMKGMTGMEKEEFIIAGNLAIKEANEREEEARKIAPGKYEIDLPREATSIEIINSTEDTTVVLYDSYNRRIVKYVFHPTRRGDS